jgi:hypothetical protein
VWPFFFLFFYYRGCPGQLARTSTNPTGPEVNDHEWISRKENFHSVTPCTAVIIIIIIIIIIGKTWISRKEKEEETELLWVKLGSRDFRRASSDKTKRPLRIKFVK